MNINIPEVKVTKFVEPYLNESCTDAFILKCKEKGLKPEITHKRLDSNWVTITLDHRTFRGGNYQMSLVFESIAVAVTKLEVCWAETYEAGIYTKEQYRDEHKN